MNKEEWKWKRKQREYMDKEKRQFKENRER